MSSLLGEARVRIRPDLSGFMRETQSGVESAGRNASSAFSKAMKTGAVALAGITVAAGLAAKSTLDIGIDYQNSLNTLQAVSNATAAQMSAVGDTAKKLGADTSLTATSAADAASAMTELAKGGLTVDQAMTAAKGTLQLAAAAGVDAASAAEIQANALNAYSLGADQAGHVADVLANAANAASGEITDFAQAIQQGGAVAHATGISLEDTAAALGILANAGIKGSDAGTLLKSALLALQSPSKPAAKAMEDLGLSAYDAAGNFVGLKSVFGQLSDAQKKMTPEAYAAATSTLFGSDAARLAGIAGQQGADGFQKMADAMGKQGAAADVAKAKSKGLGGAIEAFKSQVETFQIDLFERASPNIEKLVRYAADHFPAFGDAIMRGIDKGVAFVINFKDKAVAAFKAVADYLEPLTSALGKFWASFTKDGGGAESMFNVLKIGAGIIVGVVKAAQPLVSVAGMLVSALSKLPGPIQAVVLAFAALKVASKMDLFGNLFGGGKSSSSGSKAATAALDQTSGRLRTFGQNLAGFAQSTKANMRLAGDEVGRFTKLGGGLAASFERYMPQTSKAVSDGLASVRTAFADAKRDTRFDVAEKFNVSVRDLPKSVGDASGAIAGFGAAAKATAKGGVSALRSGVSGLVGFMGGPLGVAVAGASFLVSGYADDAQKAAASTDKFTQALISGGQGAANFQALAAKGDNASWGDRFSKWILPDSWLPDRVLSQGTKDAIDASNGMGDAQKAAEDYFKSLGPVQEAQARASQWESTLNSEIANGTPESEKAQAARRRLAYWTEVGASREHLLANEMQTSTAAVHANAQESLAKSNADIQAQMSSAGLTSQIDEYRKSLDDTSLSAAEHEQMSGQMAQTAISTAQALAAQAQAHSTASTEEGKQAEADSALLGSLKETAKQLGDNTPKAITDLIASLSGGMAQANFTASAMSNLGLTVDGIPDDKSVIIDAPTEEQAKKLSDLGYQIQTLPNGQVKVTADTSQAHTDLQDLYNWIENLRPAIINSQVNGQGGSGSGGLSGRDTPNATFGGGTGGNAHHIATGGPVFGPGTATSDSIPAWLSNGEYVVKAKAVAKYGLGFLHAVNAGKFAEGGQVGVSRRRSSRFSSAPAQSGDVNLYLTVDESKSTARDQIGDAMFELRRMKRGGVHA